MLYLYIFIAVAAFALLAAILTSLICFFRVFYSKRQPALKEDEYDIPPGEIYEPFREQMIAWQKEIREMAHEDVQIVSHDGLTLRGRYYEHRRGAPVELMFHGYQGNSDRDLCGGVGRSFALDRNVLLIDHRASGKSEGHVISFGINESRDCLAWVDFAISRFGDDVRIILTGISMGAATVMIAAGEELPKNVICVLADCGYTSARDIIKKVIRDMRLPANLLYPFVRLGARLFGHFDPDKTSPLLAMKRCRVPVIFFHGDADDFVPCDMSRDLYDACTSTKKLVIIEGAGHGLCYPMNKEKYIDAVKQFKQEYGE